TTAGPGGHSLVTLRGRCSLLAASGGGSMPTYLSPGVFVEEVEAGSRPIEGVGTAVAAFVGLAERGPFNAPTLVSNWTQFTRTFGEFVEGTYLAHSVYAYFMNGGGNCYIIRIGEDTAATNGHGRRSPKSVTAAQQATLAGYRVTAVTAAADGEISVEVVPAGGDAPSED